MISAVCQYATPHTMQQVLSGIKQGRARVPPHFLFSLVQESQNMDTQFAQQKFWQLIREVITLQPVDPLKSLDILKKWVVQNMTAANLLGLSEANSAAITLLKEAPNTDELML